MPNSRIAFGEDLQTLEANFEPTFSIRNAVLEAYMYSFNAPTEGVAVRLFMESCINPESDCFKYPEDYSLFQTGFWDEKTGQHHDLAQPRMVISAYAAIEEHVRSQKLKEQFIEEMKEQSTESYGTQSIEDNS